MMTPKHMVVMLVIQTCQGEATGASSCEKVKVVDWIRGKMNVLLIGGVGRGVRVIHS